MYFLVDFENVRSGGLRGVDYLEANDYLTIFFSNAAHSCENSDRVKRLKKQLAGVDIALFQAKYEERIKLQKILRQIFDGTDYDGKMGEIQDMICLLYTSRKEGLNMYYPEELVEEVRTRNDIVDVISGYVKLQRKGSSYFGLCPFHNEKSPSFSVSPGKQMYYCFGCGAGGNVLTFIMEYENYSFPEALKFLADRAGVKLPEQEDWTPTNFIR